MFVAGYAFLSGGERFPLLATMHEAHHKSCLCKGDMQTGADNAMPCNL